MISFSSNKHISSSHVKSLPSTEGSVQTVYEGYSESNASGLIILFSGMLGTSARQVLNTLHFAFSVIPSIAQRHYFLLSYNAFC